MFLSTTLPAVGPYTIAAQNTVGTHPVGSRTFTEDLPKDRHQSHQDVLGRGRESC